MCVRSFVRLIIAVTFQHSMHSPHFQLIFFVVVVVVDVVMHLFALFFHRVSVICAVHIDIKIRSTFISFDVRTVINIKFLGEIHTPEKCRKGEGLG